MTDLTWNISNASITSPLVELYHRNAILSSVAAVHVGLAFLFLLGLSVDHRTVAGDPAWLKPLKFAVSLALFTATLGWLGYHLPVPDETLHYVSVGVAIGTLIEVTLISGQATRGVASHFNQSTALDATVYLVMGITIFGITGLTAWLTYRAWSGVYDVSPSLAWGIRIGLAMFVIGALVGGIMVVVGASAPNPGRAVPFLGWVVDGDFRVAHFLGLHALQVLPIIGYIASILGVRNEIENTHYVVLSFAVCYGIAMIVALLHVVDS